jgi:hypothetical protein
VLTIIDTPKGERIRLTVTQHAEGLKAVVNIKRPGGVVEVLNLLPVPNDHHAFQSALAPAEPHEFDATLDLTAGAEKNSHPFHMAEPEGHHH